MLVSLRVRDFAIVDRIAVEFDSGMTVLTGETGAGKSILIDALGLVLGERGSAQLVRKGAQRAEFSAEFDISALPRIQAWLRDNSLDEDDACLLRRVIGADGRSRAFINGNAVPVQQLKTAGEFLVDIHGQHFHQSLGKSAVQRELLDFFGGLDKKRADVAAAYASWQEIQQALERLVSADNDRASRLDLLRFQLQELDALDPHAGESTDLLEERQRLQNSGRLVEGVARAMNALFDGDDANANNLVAEATHAIDALTDYDPSLAPVLQVLEGAGIQISEAAAQLRSYVDDIDMDPGRRDVVEERLDALQSIARKHRVEAAQLPDLQQRLANELSDLENAAERGKELESAAASARTSYESAAATLSAGRKNAAKKLAKQVSEAMHSLGMPGGRFDVAVERLPGDDARVHGIDSIQFRISANPGQDLQPLSKVASGGELSRMSLAIQVIASDGSNIPTMVFDEVDSGVGGGVAEMVGRRLADLGKTRQVLCVTHLPQVASLANQHYRIAKVSDGTATRTNVQVLGKDERIEELARMLGGVEITKKTLAHAAEMLADAPQKRA